MKAIILNSGIGKRMGDLAKKNPKCLIELIFPETILSRQIKSLLNSGIDEFLITTGAFEDNLKNYVYEKFPDIKVTYVFNPLYKVTNYIYSMFLAKKHLIDDVILLHGDIAAEESVYNELILCTYENAVIIDKSAPLPEKDFKGLIKNDFIIKIGTYVDGVNCSFLIPIYKLSKKSMKVWMNEIENYVLRNDTSVYAEEALNSHLEAISLFALDQSGKYCMEIDTLEELRVAKKIIQK